MIDSTLKQTCIPNLVIVYFDKKLQKELQSLLSEDYYLVNSDSIMVLIIDLLKHGANSNHRLNSIDNLIIDIIDPVGYIENKVIDKLNNFINNIDKLLINTGVYNNGYHNYEFDSFISKDTFTLRRS